MSANHLLSFYGSKEPGDGYAERQQHLHWSADRFGNIQHQHPWNHDELKKTDFYAQHQAVLDNKRGAGFWLWKPYLMLKLMQEIPEGDFLFYHDVGRAIRRNPSIGYQFDRPIDPLVDWAKQNNGMFPGVYVPMYGPSKKWIKRDCFILMDSDSEEYWNQPQVQAGINVWQNTSLVRDFIAEWLQYCEDPRILTDQENQCGQPNLPEFKDHRHDQAVLTIMLQKKGIAVYGEPNEDTLKPREVGFITHRVASDAIAKKNKLSGKPGLIRLAENHSPRRFTRGTLSLFQLLMEEQRDKTLTILEVRDQASDESTLWPAYLPNAKVHVLYPGAPDSEEHAQQRAEKRISLVEHSVDSGHRPSMEIFALQMKRAKVQFDFIIECGSGLMHDQQLAIGTLFDLLIPGGYFVVEQLEYSLRRDLGDLKDNLSNSTVQLIKRINLSHYQINSHYFSLAEARKMEQLMQTAGSDWHKGYGTGMIRRWSDSDPEKVKLSEIPD